MPRIFLLSPADCAGKRAQTLLRDAATFPLAVSLRTRGAPIGDVFAFISALYFRGKIAYARAFAAPPKGQPGAFVITSTGELVPAERPITGAHLTAFGQAKINAAEAAYRDPLTQATRELARRLGARCEIVLLGSVASDKYVSILGEVFGLRLLFPPSFVGRGDMSRGGLMLRAAADAAELDYAPVLTAVRNGVRPPKLAPRPRL